MGRTAEQEAARKAVRSNAHDSSASELTAKVVERLPDAGSRFVAHAPGRLNVMGGIADYSGALVLMVPLDEHVCVGVQRRDDDKISIESAGGANSGSGEPARIALSEIQGKNGIPIDHRVLREQLADWNKASRCVLGLLVEARRSEMISDFAGGLTVVVGSAADDEGSAGWEAALAAATLVATAQAYEAKLDPQQASQVCQRVQTDWFDWPVGVADAVCALIGEPLTLTQLRCDPCSVAGSLPMPADLALLAVDCGTTQTDARLKYTRVRTAAFMGRALVDRIVQHDGGEQGWWDGYLSRITINDYVDRFRDRIPTKMKGKEFLERFGETGDPLTRIEPGFMYKIRSRTEHHIYEHARASQFVECLSRAIRTGEDRGLAEAGDLMYASHWSYGQRCGLGDVNTDLLVSQIRKHGEGADIFGAKICGRGCGGLVAVLMRATDRAEGALAAAMQDYESKAGEGARLIRGSLPGAMVAGARQP